MRDVRRRERIAGLRRPSKKERIAKVAHVPVDTDDNQYPDFRASSQYFEDETLGEEYPSVSPPNMQGSSRRERSSSHASAPAVPDASYGTVASTRLVQLKHANSDPIPRAPDGEFVDLFGMLPRGERSSRMTDMLLKHCFHVFLPSTFPLEKKNPAQLQLRIQAVVQRQLTSGATLYGAMAISAAHRALMSGRIEDIYPSAGDQSGTPIRPEYLIMHDNALKTVNRKMQDPKTALQLDTIHGVMMLIGATLLIGNFEEMRLHLDGLVRMAHLRGDLFETTNDPATMLVLRNTLIFDIKAAEGMGTRPRLPLPLRCDQMDETLRLHVAPPSSSELQVFALKFRSIASLTPTLVNLLEGIRDIFFLHEFHFQDALGLTADQHEIFRWRSLTIEHGLLDYAYQHFPSYPDRPDKLQIPFLEAVARLSGIQFLCSVVIVSQPNSGLGRAMTRQSYELLEGFTGHCSQFSVQELELLISSICLSLYACQGQSEEALFYDRLRQVLHLRSCRTWSEFEGIVKGFLYVPRLWETFWKRMYDHAQGLDLVSLPGV